MGYDVGDVAHLTADFYVGPDPGTLADPLTVTFRWRRPNGVIPSAVAATKDAVGRYSYDLELDLAGEWRWEFKGLGGDAQGTQGGVIRVSASVVDTPSAFSLVPVEDVATAMGREMTAAELSRAEQLIPQLVKLMERKLNRDLLPRAYTDERHHADVLGQIRTFHGPVASVQQITVDTYPYLDADTLGMWDAAMWTPFSEVLISYTTTGILETDDADAGADVRAVLVDTIARTLLTVPAVATGAIKGYSVEGTSITYGDVGAGGQSGRFTVGDMSGIGRLRRRVLV